MENEETVVFLHGLSRTRRSMRRIEKAFERKGHRCLNVPYPSTRYPIERLAEIVVDRVRDALGEEARLHFVTHSLGGIIVREIASRSLVSRMGRVVMIAPPNAGSEVVDRIGSWWLFDAVNGPAGHELGTDAGSKPNQLGPFDFDCGVIAGNRPVEPWLAWMLPKPNDGKVTVASAFHPSARDTLVVRATHAFIMNHKKVIEAATRFIATGSFGSGEGGG